MAKRTKADDARMARYQIIIEKTALWVAIREYLDGVIDRDGLEWALTVDDCGIAGEMFDIDTAFLVSGA